MLTSIEPSTGVDPPCRTISNTPASTSQRHARPTTSHRTPQHALETSHTTPEHASPRHRLAAGYSHERGYHQYVRRWCNAVHWRAAFPGTTQTFPQKHHLAPTYQSTLFFAY